MASSPNVLACAGLDPSGGAGLLADARVIEALGGRPVGVVTTLTVQNTTGVADGLPVDAELLRAQLECLLSDVEVRAVKIGMLGSGAVARALAEALALTSAPVVWDPVLYPSRGELPHAESYVAEALVALVPHVALLTPNARELAILAGGDVATLADALAAARKIRDALAVDVLVKGGHLGGERAVDVLVARAGEHAFDGPRLPDGEHVHGTGCALSSAIATQLAHGRAMIDAIAEAKAFVAARIAHPAHPGRGAPALV